MTTCFEYCLCLTKYLVLPLSLSLMYVPSIIFVLVQVAEKSEFPSAFSIRKSVEKLTINP